MVAAVVVAFLVVGYAAISWVFSSQLIAPDFEALGAKDPSAFGLPQPEAARIESDGVTLSGWYFENPRDEDCAVIMMHGFSGSRSEVLAPSPIFWDRGCDLLLYDSRGHGDSSPALLTYGAHERRDLARAIDWLSAASDLPRSRIGLIGWSYGAAVSIQAASEVRDVAFVVADSSYSSLGDIARAQADKQFGSWARAFVPGALFIAGRRGDFDARKVAPDDAIRRVTAPVLLIHSRQDGFTPVEHTEEIYANSDKRRTELLIPEWEAKHAHSYTEDEAAYTAAVDEFLATHVPDFGVRRER